MMTNKKGVSDVVTTVLIILFGIVAVAIIGAIVINQVRTAGDKIDSTSQCQDVDITPVKCTITLGSPLLSIQRGSNLPSTITVNKVSAVFISSDGTTNVNDKNKVGTDLKTDLATSTSSSQTTNNSAGTYAKAGVAVELIKDGKTINCDLYKNYQVSCA